MAEIFICYRRNDSEGHAGRLHDGLQERFGARAVFVDVDNLHPGVDFEDVIQRTLLRSTVVLVVIGPRWLDQRLRNEADYVRREIIAALKGKQRLIPVLVGDARMPTRDKLPPELSALAGKNAVTLRHATWRADVARLITSLERILGRKKAAAKPASPPASKAAPKKKTRPGTPRGKAPVADLVMKEKSPSKPRPTSTKETVRAKKADKAQPAPPAQRGKKPEARRAAGKSKPKPGITQQPSRGSRNEPNDKAAPRRGNTRPAGKSRASTLPRPKAR